MSSYYKIGGSEKDNPIFSVLLREMAASYLPYKYTMLLNEINERYSLNKDLYDFF